VDAAKTLSEDMIAFGSSAEVLTFNNNALWHPEMKKKEVRQAINHAINCQEIVDTLYNGLTECVGNLIWYGVIGSTKENTAPYKYDPERAKALLKQANYDPATEIGIYGRATRVPKQVEIYEAMQAYMKAVGINAKIHIIEAGERTKRTGCGIGRTVNEVVKDRGGDPAKDTPTRDDFQKAILRGPQCPFADIMENEPSNETLDFGRQANYYMNCVFPRSQVCDPSPGGYQDQLAVALAASGADRQVQMQKLADAMHNESLFTFGFKLPVVYALDPKLNFKPRFDGRIRVNHLWFNP
jgi:ABC-type transport system substrate-binding protein